MYFNDPLDIICFDFLILILLFGTANKLVSSISFLVSIFAFPVLTFSPLSYILNKSNRGINKTIGFV